MSRLDRPIFVIYVNVSGISRQRQDDKIQSMIDSISPILGEDNIFFPIEQGESRIELLWSPNNSGQISSSFMSVLDDAFSFIESNWRDESIVKENILKIRTSLRSLKISQIED